MLTTAFGYCFVGFSNVLFQGLLNMVRVRRRGRERDLRRVLAGTHVYEFFSQFTYVLSHLPPFFFFFF